MNLLCSRDRRSFCRPLCESREVTFRLRNLPCLSQEAEKWWDTHIWAHPGPGTLQLPGCETQQKGENELFQRPVNVKISSPSADLQQVPLAGG